MPKDWHLLILMFGCDRLVKWGRGTTQPTLERRSDMFPPDQGNLPALFLLSQNPFSYVTYLVLLLYPLPFIIKINIIIQTIYEIYLCN